MKSLIYLVVAALVAVRLWFRFRRRASGPRRGRTHLGPVTSDVGLVATREIRERLRGKIFRVGTIFMLLVVAAAIIIPTINKGKAGPEEVGVVGTLSPAMRSAVISTGEAVGASVQFVLAGSVGVARGDLRDGRVDFVIVNGDQLMINQALSPSDGSTTAQLVPALAQSLGDEAALRAAGLTPAQTNILEHAKALEVISLSHAKAHVVSASSIIGLVLLFTMLSQYNTWILMGVMEEKSSRVVEVLLATVRPMQLLAGKVLGIGTVALAQASLVVAFALALAKVVGSTFLHGTAPLALLSTFVWLLLGFAFYCWVYAAAGSLAERQDQVQSLALPLAVPMIFGYIVSITAASSGSASALFKVLAYIPLTAPFAMPVLVGFGDVTWWQFAASALVSIVCTVAVARGASTIYRRAILRTGRRVRLREILTRTAR